MAAHLSRFGSRIPTPVKHRVRAAQAVWGRSTIRFRILPQFLIIGAQRCGTTSLYKYLVQHPLVAAPPLGKGAHFFDMNYEKGEGWYRGHFPASLHRADDRLDRRITGEGSPYYLFHPCAPERVAGMLPGVKLIVMLRDPVSRAYSHYWHEVARSFESLSFERAIACEPERLAGEDERLRTQAGYTSFSHQHWSYLARGRYAEHLKAWYACFERGQLLVLSSREFFRDPDGAYAKVLEFLGLPPHRLARYEAFNPRDYPPMQGDLRRRLAEQFERPNAELFDLLDVGPDWLS